MVAICIGLLFYASVLWVLRVAIGDEYPGDAVAIMVFLWPVSAIFIVPALIVWTIKESVVKAVSIVKNGL